MRVEDVEFAQDSALEGTGFELLVPIAMARPHRGDSKRYLSDDRQAAGDHSDGARTAISDYACRHGGAIRVRRASASAEMHTFHAS